MRTIENENIIIISSIDWDTQYQLHHQLTDSLLKRNNKILFIENTGVRNVNFKDTKRINDRILRWFKSYKGFTKIKKNLSLFSPVLLPFPYNRIALKINNFLFSDKILQFINIENFNKPIIISFLPTPLISNLVNKINYKLLIYYCANNMSEGSLGASELKKYEKKFILRSDLVIVISKTLERMFKKIKLPKIIRINLGINFNEFKKAKKINKKIYDIDKIQNPIIGYVGGISKVLNKNLLIGLFKKYKKINFVFVGPLYTGIRELKIFKNVFFLGQKSHKEIPYYIKKFDIGIIPYVKNNFTKSVYVSKLCEYLAMGKPVISSDINEVVSFNSYNNNIVDIYSKREDLYKIINFYVNKNFKISNERVLNNLTVAKNNDWEKKFLQLEKCIIRSLEQKKNINNFKNNFKYFYYSKRNLIVKGFLYLSLIYLLLKSPLMVFAGKYLEEYKMPEKADAIVIFTGDAGYKYKNSTFENRARDALFYYKNGYSKNIILSPGKVKFINDEEIIKNFLISNNVKEKNIYITDGIPKNTYEKIVLLNEYLDKKSIKKILLITSPYHYKRTMMLWKNKNYKRKVIPVRPLDYTKKKFNLQFSNIQMIIYEYLSILYNFYKGRL